MKVFCYMLFVSALFCALAITSHAQAIANNWNFAGGSAVSFDAKNTYTIMQQEGQLFRMAGTPFPGRPYSSMQFQFRKLYAGSDDSLLATPISFAAEFSVSSFANLAEVRIAISFRTKKGASFPSFVTLKRSAGWQTVVCAADVSSRDPFHSISIDFVFLTLDSSAFSCGIMARNLTLMYGSDSAVVLDGMRDTVTVDAVGNDHPLIPSTSQLMQNYPNPFNPSTTIPYVLNEGGDVDLQVFDLLGREVILLERGYKPAGTHTTRFDGSSLPSGTYCALLRFNGKPMGVRKLLLVK